MEEPGDLWSAGLPERFRDRALRLAAATDGDENGYQWVHPDGRPVNELEEPSRRSVDGSTPAELLAGLDQDGIAGAVLYPSTAGRAFSACPDSALLGAVLDVYNDWILAFAAPDPDRLKPVALVNVDDPADGARSMRGLADRGAAGFALPCAPGEGNRYDQRRYEVLWATAAELGRPISLLVGTGRTTQERSPDGQTGPGPDSMPTMAGVLAFHATSAFPTRRSLTAMIFAGVFERHPDLRVGAVGFGASWAAYAMVRANEMYEVRPERAGPPTRVPETIRRARPGADADPEVRTITGENRTGTRGMAPEGIGYHFPDGERFDDHFRRNVFLTFRKDELALVLRDFVGVQTLLWGQGRPQPQSEPADSEAGRATGGGSRATPGAGSDVEAGGQARKTLDEFLADVPEGDRGRITRDNTARIYGFDTAEAIRGSQP